MVTIRKLIVLSLIVMGGGIGLLALRDGGLVVWIPAFPIFQAREEVQHAAELPTVLSATSSDTLRLNVQVESEFARDAAFLSDVRVDGDLEAPNLVYGIIAGEGLSVSGVQTPTIANTDLGSAQNIFKTITVGSTDISAESNTDTLTLKAGDLINLSTSGKEITIGTSADNYKSWSFAVDGTTKDGITAGDVLDFVSGTSIAITRNDDDKLTFGLDATDGLTVGSSGQFVIDSSGNITKLNNVDYSFPSAQGAASSVLMNDGVGALSWGTFGAASVTPDSLDFAQFVDAMTVDADTSINLYNGGATDLRFFNSNSGSDLLFLDGSTGRLGIGTTAPARTLDVYGRVKIGEVLYFASDNTNNDWHINATTEAGLGFSESGVADGRLYLKEGGNVGIGTTSPAYKLHVGGDTLAGGIYLNNSDIGLTTDADLLSLADNALTVNGALTATGAVSGASLTDGTTTFADTAWTSMGAVAWNLANSSTTSLNIESGLLNLDTQNSRVGIGTTSPTQKLHVVGNSLFQTSSDTTTAFQWLDADGGTPILNIDSTNERMGIGIASPTTVLDVTKSVPGEVLATFSNFASVSTPNDANSAILARAHYDRASIPTSPVGGFYAIHNSNSVAVAGIRDVLEIGFDNAAADGILASGVGVGVKYTARGSNDAADHPPLARTAAILQGVSSGSLTSTVPSTTYNSDFAIETAVGGTLTEHMRVTFGGNVGIGTSNPSSLLSVGASSQFQVNSSGTALLPDGSTASPALTFTGDTNSGLYRLGTDKIGLVTGGVSTQGITIDASGNVGIGLTNPSARLTLGGNSPSANKIRLYYQYPSFTSIYSEIYDNGGGGGLIIANNYNNPDGGIILDTAGATNPLRITNAGNIGLGEDNPGSKLSVSGGATIGASYDTFAAPTNGLLVEGNVGIGTISPATKLDVNGTAWLRGNGSGLYVNSSGNVGIGTTSPGTMLHLAHNSTGSVIRLENIGSASANETLGAIEFIRDTTIVGAKIRGIAEQASGNLHSGLIFSTSNSGGTLTDHVKIDTEGQVGFGGLMSPPAVISLGSSSLIGDGTTTVNTSGVNVYVDSGSGGGQTGPYAMGIDHSAGNAGSGLLIKAGRNSDTLDYPLRILNQNSTELLSVIGTGNVGLGTASPSQRLQVNTGTSATVITSSGSVGIGTTSPAYTLDVRGDINASGDIRKNGTAYTNPDYVFEPDYPLMPLADLKLYVDENKHLPNVPSSEDIRRDGVRLFEQTRLNLEKTEEAYLYLFGLDDRVSTLSLSLPTITSDLSTLKEQGGKQTLGVATAAPQDGLQLDEQTSRELSTLLEGLEIDSETGALEVKQETRFIDRLIARAQALFEKAVTFLAEVTFGDRVTFEDRDMGGFAIIKTGADEVEVVFEKPYAQTPIVSVTLATDDETAEDHILGADLTWNITNRSPNGFTIKLNTATPVDTQFSWTALAITDARTTESEDTGDITEPNESVQSQQVDESLAPIQTEEPTATASSTSSIESTPASAPVDQLNSHGEPTIATGSASQ